MKEIIIKSRKPFSLDDFKDIWSYRELFFIFAWRDIKVRYKQTILGILWVIFQPLITMIIFTVFFGKLTKIPSSDLPYSLFVLSGLVFWTFFSGALSHASESMIANVNLIKKVYFPKIILPLSSTATYFVDFIINLILLLIYASILGFFPRPIGLVIFPFAMFISILTAIGLGLITSSLNVKYRDIRYALPFFIQLFLFVTPVIYPLAITSRINRTIMSFNPMASVVEMSRLVFSENYPIEPHLIMISISSSVIILIVGFWYFRRTEQFFADIA